MSEVWAQESGEKKDIVSLSIRTLRRGNVLRVDIIVDSFEKLCRQYFVLRIVVAYLHLVLACLSSRAGVEEIDGENLVSKELSAVCLKASTIVHFQIIRASPILQQSCQASMSYAFVFHRY